MANEIKKIQVGLSNYDIRDGRLFTLADNSTTTAGTWLAKCDDLTAYADGQLFLYKITKAGASTTTLNINSIGAKTVYRYGNTKLGTHYPVGTQLLLVYCLSLNSGCFIVVNDYDATNSNTIPAAYCNTAASTAAKVATHTDYALLNNSYELVTIKTANSYNGPITLNINSQGAKPIYINGAASSSSNKTLPAGTYLVFYDGTNYYFNTDGKVKGLVSSAGDTMTGDFIIAKGVGEGKIKVGSGTWETSHGYSNISDSAQLTLKANNSTITQSIILDTIGGPGVTKGIRITSSNDGKTTIDGTDIPKNEILEVTSNKVSSWSTTTTDTHYPSEKLVKDECDNIREVAEGKCKSFVLSYNEPERTEANYDFFPPCATIDGTVLTTWSQFSAYINTYGANRTYQNSNFNSQNNTISVFTNASYILTAPVENSTSPIVIRDIDYTEHLGDIFLVTETDVPDRWYGGSGTAYKLETSKVDLAGYVNAADTGLKLVANGTSGKKVQHTNSVTAKTTQGLVKVAYDAQGHITGSTAVAKGDLTGLGVADDSLTVHKAGTETITGEKTISGASLKFNKGSAGGTTGSITENNNGVLQITNEGGMNISSMSTQIYGSASVAISGTNVNISSTSTTSIDNITVPKGTTGKTFATTDQIPSTASFVTGPASATDNAIARFDGTTGKLVQNSNVTIDDGGVVWANSVFANDIIGSQNELDVGEDDNFQVYVGQDGNIDINCSNNTTLHTSDGSNLLIENIAVPKNTSGKTFATTDLATSSTAGLVKSSTTGTTANRNYNVQVNNDGTMKVNVPWSDTDTGATSVETTGSGNAVTTASYNASNRKLTLTKGSTFSLSNHTHNFADISSRGEEYLDWGGPSKVGSVSPIGMALSSEHSANRAAFINGNAITAEYSSDAGSTWTTYTEGATSKSQLFTQSYSFNIGRASQSTEYTTNSRTRITLTAQDGTNGYLYTSPKKMLINISSSGSMQVLVETRTGANYKSGGAWTTFGTYSLSGWSGWNDIPLILGTLGGGTSQTSNNWQLRLTFIMTSKNTSYPTTAAVNSIRIFGDNAWTAPSNLASTGHLYTFGMDQGVTFPAQLYTAGNIYMNNKVVATQEWVNSNNSDVVHKTGDETVTGVKTFAPTIKMSSGGSSTSLLQFYNNGNYASLSLGATTLAYYGTSNIQYGVSIMPTATNSKDLGSLIYNWKDLYLSNKIFLKSKHYSTSDDIVTLSVDGGSAKSWPKTLAIDGAVYGSSNFNIEGYLNIGGAETTTGTQLAAKIDGSLHVTTSTAASGWAAQIDGRTALNGVTYVGGHVWPKNASGGTVSANLGDSSCLFQTTYTSKLGALSDDGTSATIDTYEVMFDSDGYKPLGHTHFIDTTSGMSDQVNVTVYFHPKKHRHKVVMDIRRPSVTNLTHGTISVIGHKWYIGGTTTNYLYPSNYLSNSACTTLFNRISFTSPTLSTYYAQLEKSSSVISKSSTDPNAIYNFNGNGVTNSVLANNSSGDSTYVYLIACELDNSYSGNLYLHDWHAQVVWYQKE